MAKGVAGSSAEIALWQEVEIEPIAYKRACFPCYILKILEEAQFWNTNNYKPIILIDDQEQMTFNITTWM